MSANVSRRLSAGYCRAASGELISGWSSSIYIQSKITRMQRRVHRPLKQTGFALIELILAISLTALLAVYASAQLARQSEETIAEGAAKYISLVSAASQQHVVLNWNAYSTNTPVAGVANLLAPTLPELVAAGRLNAGFPTAAGSLPTRQTLRIDVTRTNCPGVGCLITTLVCTTAPVTLGGADVRFDLASTMVDKQVGNGGQSLQNNGAVIRGPALNIANPVGNVEGIVCGSASVDTAMLQQFLVLNEPRDPNFQGPVTIAGATQINSTAAITGTLSAGGNTSVGACAAIRAATGRAGFGCAGPDDLPAGYAGGVRSVDVVATGNIVASDNPAAFTGANGAYAYVGVAGGVAAMRTSGNVAAAGAMTATGAVSGNVLTPSGSFAANTACVAFNEATIGRNLDGSGLVVCQNAVWRSIFNFRTAGDACVVNGEFANSGGLLLLCVNSVYRSMADIVRSGTPGAACAIAGATAIDTANNNEMLICRSNLAAGTPRYMRLRDVTQHLAFVSSVEVTDVTLGATGVVTKPACAPAATQTAFGVIQLIPKIHSSPDGGTAMYAVDNGANWSIFLRNGSNNVLTGTPSAIAVAQVYCYFP